MVRNMIMKNQLDIDMIRIILITVPLCACMHSNSKPGREEMPGCWSLCRFVETKCFSSSVTCCIQLDIL